MAPEAKGTTKQTGTGPTRHPPGLDRTSTEGPRCGSGPSILQEPWNRPPIAPQSPPQGWAFTGAKPLLHRSEESFIIGTTSAMKMNPMKPAIASSMTGERS
jgi:hypothetical protein